MRVSNLCSFLTLVGVVFVLPFMAKAQTTPEPLNLTGVVRFAIEHAPEVNTRARELQARELELKSATTAFLPSLDLEAIHGLADDGVDGNGSNRVGRFRVSLTESLFDNGVDWIRYRQAQLARERAELSLREEKNRIAILVIDAFIDHSAAIQALEVDREQHDLVSQQFKIVQALYRQGLKTKSDFIRLNAEVLSSEQRILDSEIQVKRTEAELRRVIGLPLESISPNAIRFAPLKLVDTELSPLPSAVPSLDSQLIWKISDLDRQIEEQRVRTVAREWGPRLYLTGGLEYGRDGYLDRSGPQSDGWSWNALATVRWNLWDWGNRSRQIEVARINRSIVENRLTSDLLARRQEVENLMLEIKRTTENLRVNRELLKLERESYGLVEREFRNGQAGYLSLISALSTLASARLRGITTVANFHKSSYRYRYFEGTLHDSFAQN